MSVHGGEGEGMKSCSNVWVAEEEAWSGVAGWVEVERVVVLKWVAVPADCGAGVDGSGGDGSAV